MKKLKKKKALIKDTYDRMVLDLKRQEEMLDIVEKNVIEAEDNAKKAKEEIRKTDEARKSNRKKLRCIIF